MNPIETAIWRRPISEIAQADTKHVPHGRFIPFNAPPETSEGELDMANCALSITSQFSSPNPIMTQSYDEILVFISPNGNKNIINTVVNVVRRIVCASVKISKLSDEKHTLKVSHNKFTVYDEDALRYLYYMLKPKEDDHAKLNMIASNRTRGAIVGEFNGVPQYEFDTLACVQEDREQYRTTRLLPSFSPSIQDRRDTMESLRA